MIGKSWLLASVGVAMLMPVASFAQTAKGPDDKPSASGSDGDIVITARRRNEKLADVPAAVSVIDSQALTDRGGATDMRALVADQPSVRFNNLQASYNSEVSIRASSTARATNGDSSVGLYRNGAYVGGGAQGGRTFSRFDLFDAAQIEVLRGNQGALYGRDAVGGAINVLTARPSQTASGYLSVRGGNLDYIEYEGVVNQPLGDGLALRLSADVISLDEVSEWMRNFAKG